MPPAEKPTGLIVYKGYIVAEWGEPLRVDMTHSVTKSFLSTVIGLAVDKGLIHSVFDTVAAGRDAGELSKPQLLFPFSGPHNSALTWDVLLRQTSDWEGVLWGKPDWADRPDDKQPDAGMVHPIPGPGTDTAIPGSYWTDSLSRLSAVEVIGAAGCSSMHMIWRVSAC